MFITEIRRSIFKTTDYGGNKKKVQKGLFLLMSSDIF